MALHLFVFHLKTADGACGAGETSTSLPFASSSSLFEGAEEEEEEVASRCKHWRLRAQFQHPCPPRNRLMKFRSAEWRCKHLFSAVRLARLSAHSASLSDDRLPPFIFHDKKKKHGNRQVFRQARRSTTSSQLMNQGLHSETGVSRGKNTAAFFSARCRI